MWKGEITGLQAASVQLRPDKLTLRKLEITISTTDIVYQVQ